MPPTNELFPSPPEGDEELHEIWVDFTPRDASTMRYWFPRIVQAVDYHQKEADRLQRLYHQSGMYFFIMTYHWQTAQEGRGFLRFLAHQLAVNKALRLN